MRIPEEKLKEIYNYYLSHDIGLVKTTELFNISYKTIQRYIKRNNLESTLKNKQIKMTFNSSYFHDLDSQEKMYWFGFLYADGSITINEKKYIYKLSLCLQERDKNHLIKFAKALNLSVIEEKIKLEENSFSTNSNKKFKAYRIYLCSKELVTDLIKLGCIPRKTYEGILRKNLFLNKSKELKLAFLRGYIDGDGTIHYKKWCVYISVYRKEIAEFIKWLINDIFPEINVIIRFRENIKFKKNLILNNEKNGYYVVSIQHKEEAKEFLQEIYKNATIFLDAKYQIYLALENALR